MKETTHKGARGVQGREAEAPRTPCSGAQGPRGASGLQQSCGLPALEEQLPHLPKRGGELKASTGTHGEYSQRFIVTTNGI